MEPRQVFNMTEPVESVPSFDEVMGVIKAQNEAIVGLKSKIEALEGRAGASEEKLAALASSASAAKAEGAQIVKSKVDAAYEKALEELGIKHNVKE